MKDKAKLTDEEKAKKEEAEKDVKGVPDFWLTIFKNVDMLQDMVQEHDEAAMSALLDITVDFSQKPMVSKRQIILLLLLLYRFHSDECLKAKYSDTSYMNQPCLLKLSTDQIVFLKRSALEIVPQKLAVSFSFFLAGIQVELSLRP